MTIIDGKAAAAEVRDRVAREVAAFVERTGRRPGLATILVGNDPASEVYVASKRKACVAAGMADLHRHLDAAASSQEIASLIDELAEDDAVSGILLQLPLPASLDADSLIERIPAHKDVDGLTATNAGRLTRGMPGLRPCTPLGVLALLDSTGVDLTGRHAVVVGRSALVGRPVAQLLLARNATVTIAHSRTRALAELTRSADVVVAAAGVPGLLTADHIRDGAVVIDVGIHRVDGRLVGDVDFDGVRAKASHVTPVPGGVGPMTIAMLLSNTLEAAATSAAKYAVY